MLLGETENESRSSRYHSHESEIKLQYTQENAICRTFMWMNEDERETSLVMIRQPAFTHFELSGNVLLSCPVCRKTTLYLVIELAGLAQQPPCTLDPRKKRL